jgi:hypothetical protein
MQKEEFESIPIPVANEQRITRTNPEQASILDRVKSLLSPAKSAPKVNQWTRYISRQSKTFPQVVFGYNFMELSAIDFVDRYLLPRMDSSDGPTVDLDRLREFIAYAREKHAEEFRSDLLPSTGAFGCIEFLLEQVSDRREQLTIREPTD